MIRRRTLADARLALGVRRLQEKAALLKLQVQQHVAARAQDEFDGLVRDHLESETSWASALQHPAFDPIATGLWRARTAVALADVRLGEQSVVAEKEAVAERQKTWADQLRLAEAVDGVERAAARAVHRADDERRLHAVEDAGHARRRRL